MSYKKAPSISHIKKKEQVVVNKKAYKQYWNKIYSQHPELKKAIEEYVKNQITNE